MVHVGPLVVVLVKSSQRVISAVEGPISDPDRSHPATHVTLRVPTYHWSSLFDARVASTASGKSAVMSVRRRDR
jgi:hypothetical protein